ncbi:MAG: ATP-binding protein [Bacillota bacterium]
MGVPDSFDFLVDGGEMEEGIRAFDWAGTPLGPPEQWPESLKEAVTLCLREAHKRAEALTELDRAKTAFFTGVGREFRTPLTLMLEPVEDLLCEDAGLSPAAKERLEVMRRNGLRLLCLVNALEDFSRIESGRVQAVFEPTDLAAFTAELADVFRGVVERAGLSLRIDCPTLPEPVYVDRDMWEKIVLKLVSNALKFTFEGEIEVKLYMEASGPVLKVRDTGVGVSADELPHLFERFHRARNLRGRTREGNGVGLALVRELVGLHGGVICAQSALGLGTEFTVTLLSGKEHLSPDRIGSGRTQASTAVGASPFLEEALRWLPEEHGAGEAAPQCFCRDLIPVPCPAGEAEDPSDRPVILIADDNADMRRYLARLTGERYRAMTVPDGAAALAAAREKRPDLILSDVMMPNLDGFALVREIRADDALKTVPIILLSEQAGEESRVEGLECGADDYLVKPIGSRELMARIAAHIDMARLRREATEQILNERRRLLGVMETLSVMVRLMTPDHRVVFSNRAFREKFGEPGGRRCYEYCCGYSEPCPFCEAFVPLKTGKAHRWEFVSPKDDTVIDAYDFPFSDTDGSPLILEMDIDITEHRRAEEQLRESRARFQSVLDNSIDVIYRMDIRTDKFDYISPSAETMMGYAPERYMAMRSGEALSMIHPDDMPAMHKAMERLHDAGEAEAVYRQRAQSGEYRWISNHMSLTRDSEGRPLYRNGNIRDITELKQKEEELLRSGEKYRALFDSIDEGFSIIEVLFDGNDRPLDYRFLEVNGSFERQTGLADAVGRSIRDIAPDNEQHWFDIYGRIALTGEPARFQSPAKALGRFYDVYAFRVGQPEQRRVAILFNDITATRQAEEALRESEKKALALVDELEKADRNKNDFISVLSHELRNPLAAIVAGLSILEIPAGQTQKEKAMGIMKRQIRQLCKLVDDLLDLTRITQNKIRLKQEDILLNEIVTNAVEDIRPEFEKKGVRIFGQIKADPIVVSADPVRLTQCIGNILYNALKFTQAGGSVWVSLRTEGNEAAVCVRDNGIGMDPEMLAGLFLPFVQADQSLDRHNSLGLGLGLAIVKGIVEMHGGRVLAGSDGLGKGSSFTIRLPITGGNIKADNGGAAGKEKRGYKILIIEDNKDLTEILCSMFTVLGHRVFAACDGTEGIKKAKEVRPDVVFCDIGLPGTDGYEVAKIIKREDELKGALLIALTGYAGENDVERAKKNGFDRHLAKPVDMVSIERLLAEIP